MPIATVLAAAEAGAETSKTAFYVLGGLLALSAVAVAVAGLRLADFPHGRRGERAVIAWFALLVVGAMVSAVATA
jgi:hypothetical protein